MLPFLLGIRLFPTLNPASYAIVIYAPAIFPCHVLVDLVKESLQLHRMHIVVQGYSSLKQAVVLGGRTAVALLCVTIFELEWQDQTAVFLWVAIGSVTAVQM